MNQTDPEYPLPEEQPEPGQEPEPTVPEPEPEEPVAEVARPWTGARRIGARLRRLLVRVLLAIYLLAVLAFGYWYWTRPVRVDQFIIADEKWRGIAEIYHVPLPEDERWAD